MLHLRAQRMLKFLVIVNNSNELKILEIVSIHIDNRAK
jgi:hypothetical protein